MSGWVLYSTESGRAVVREEIRSMLPKAGTAALGVLLKRIEDKETLPRDTARVTGTPLLEARLTYDGQEFRLYFAVSTQDGRPVLLGLRAVNKKSRKASPQDLRLSQERLRDWNDRQRSA